MTEKTIRQGKWKVYYESGKLHYKGNYKDGKQNGRGMSIDLNNQVQTGIFKDGFLIEKK